MLPRKKHIYLIGFSGSGKSTVGPQLAKRMKRPFIDTDDLIAHHLRLTIPEIFIEFGEKRFRQAERDIIKRVASSRKPTVIAVGGGAFQSRVSRSVMQSSGTTIYLSCARRELHRRLRDHTDRPKLDGSGKLGQSRRHEYFARIGMLLNRRLKNYRRADVTISTTTRTPADVVDRIILKLDSLNA